MSRTTTLVLFVTVAAGAAIWLWAGSRETTGRRAEIRRDAFEVPRPSDAAKNTYLFDLFVSGRSLTLGTNNYPIWRMIGENGLLRCGDGALDYLMDPARYPVYHASPDVLINVFRILLTAPEAIRRPGYEAFLEHWLDPNNAPREMPGSNPAEQFRARVFALFTRGVQPWVVPYCEQELDRVATRDTDLRKVAIAALLHLGRTAAIVERFDRLPPNEQEPNVHLRPFTLYELRKLAMPGVPEERRDGVRKFEPLLRHALEGDEPYSRINAASTLLKLGDTKMVDTLLDLAAEYEAKGDREACWSALVQLSEDSDDPRLRERAEKRLRDDPDNLDFTQSAALQILAIHWIAEPEVREKLWKYVYARNFDDLRPIRWLSLYPEERKRIVANLREAFRGDDITVQQAALRFATHPNYPLPELMPDVLQAARERSRDEGRSRLVSSLVTMGFRPVIPTLTADLEEQDPNVRAAAAAGLLEFGEDEDVAPVARRLNDRDSAMIAPLLQRVRSLGREGVAESLLPALLRFLESAPNEEARQLILLILRCRGTLDGIDEGLMDAYRREPSSRLAKSIRAAIIELAHGCG